MAGTAARWTVVAAVGASVWPTLIVNVTGSLALGLFAGWWVQHRHPHDRISLLVGVGVLGSFTTFSTFTVETVELLRDGALVASLGYPLVSVAAGLGAAALGAVWGAQR